MSNHGSNVRTERDLSSGEQKLLVEVYEEYKHVITQKGNTVTITKNREAAWQKHRQSVECISSIRRNIFELNIDHLIAIREIVSR